MELPQDDATTDESDERTIVCATSGTRWVFTDRQGSTDCWLSINKSACVPENEWR